jgi:YfiH family protein
MNLLEHTITPDWPAPAKVRTLQTMRKGGASAPPYHSLNLADHVGDAPLSVEHNRLRLEPLLPSEPVWLRQVHGTVVVDAGNASCLPEADACFSSHPGAVCAVLTADCLPLLLCNDQGTVVAAVHAGWRGLRDGIIERTVQAMNVPPASLMAWFGPAIGPHNFEVGEDVHSTMIAAQPEAAAAFQAAAAGIAIETWLADLYQLARLRLNALDISRIYGGNLCTYAEPDRFFSHRRDGVTGRMGTFIWIE